MVLGKGVDLCKKLNFDKLVNNRVLEKFSSFNFCFDFQVALFKDTPRTLGADTSSRDFLAHYNTGDQLRVASLGDRVYSDAGYLTSWSVFSVSESQKFDILFSVSRNTPFSSQTEARLQFNQVKLYIN